MFFCRVAIIRKVWYTFLRYETASASGTNRKDLLCPEAFPDGGEEARPVRTDVIGRKGTIRRIVSLVLAAGILACVPALSWGEADGGLPAADLYEPETILAMDAVQKLDIRQDGQLLQIRDGRKLRGRGIADEEGQEPDYTGVIGYAAVDNDPGYSESPRFPSYFWMIPVYEDTEAGIGGQYGKLSHKMPLVAIGQKLTATEDGRYKGYVRAIRLDRQEICWIDVHCFTTVDYWSLPPAEATAYGYCLAVYREGSRSAPRTAEGRTVSLRDGTRVLLPYAGAREEESPDPENLTVTGIVFRKAEGKAIPVVVFFHEQDLTLTY